jgi:hypothetical protein
MSIGVIAGRMRTGEVYNLGMKNDSPETIERLLRVRAMRRGKPIELCVHYERAAFNGCDTYRLFSIEDANKGTSTD